MICEHLLWGVGRIGNVPPRVLATLIKASPNLLCSDFIPPLPVPTFCAGRHTLMWVNTSKFNMMNDVTIYHKMTFYGKRNECFSRTYVLYKVTQLVVERELLYSLG